MVFMKRYELPILHKNKGLNSNLIFIFIKVEIVFLLFQLIFLQYLSVKFIL